MESNERIVRDFYAARARRDWDAVRELLAEKVVWRETDGSPDYSGDHHDGDHVAELLAKFVEITDGTFELEPREFVSTADHVAASVRWRADRGGVHVEGNDLAVFRIVDRRIAEAWFFQDGYDPQALEQVFSFAPSE
jgi:ketosteroid isomerase-like protein